MRHVAGAISFLCSTGILVLLIVNMKQRSDIDKLVRSRLDSILSHLNHLYMLMDTLAFGSCNPFSKALFSKLRHLDIDKLPVDEHGFHNLLRELAQNKFQEAIAWHREKIEQSETDDERDFYKTKMTKLQEMYTMMDTIDENSSQEYINLINQELFKAVSQFNENHE